MVPQAGPGFAGTGASTGANWQGFLALVEFVISPKTAINTSHADELHHAAALSETAAPTATCSRHGAKRPARWPITAVQQIEEATHNG